MVQILRLFSVVLAAAAAPLVAEAQTNEATPSVTIMLLNSNELVKDVDDLLKFVNEPKQAEVVKGYLEDVFLVGIDRTKPIRIDLILGDKQMRYRSSFPIADFDEFRTNLDAFGIQTRRLRANYYKLDKAFVGWMRVKDGYAIIAEKEADIPLGIEDPQKALAPLVAKRYDAAVSFRNTAVNADAMVSRRKAFQSVREEALAALKPGADETKAQFEFRKLLADQQMNELERFYVESEQLTMGWFTSIPNKRGWMEIQLKPIAGTSLEDAVKQLGGQPSHFANIQRRENAILSARVNHPLDEMRQKQVTEFANALNATLKAETDAAADVTADQKSARKRTIDILAGMLDRGGKEGLLDGFVEVQEVQPGKHTAVGGVKTSQMETAVELLQSLPDAKLAEKVEMNIAEAGPVKIHSVTVSPNKWFDFRGFFGGDVLYVGTSPEALWYAAGDNALEQLKEAVARIDEPITAKADGPFVNVFVKVGPWLELRDKRKAQEPQTGQPAAKLSEEEAKKQQDRAELRKLAIRTFRQHGEDHVILQLRREANDVKGELMIYPGIIRLVGEAVAKFSREQLE